MSYGGNPYQPPVAPPPVSAPTAAIPGAGVWRQGNLLVMHKRVKLPPRCVKTNRPAEKWLRRDLSWHHPALFVTVFAGVLIYVVLAMILRKTAKIQIGLTAQQFARRRMHVRIMWGLVILSFAVIGVALVFGTNIREYLGPVLLAGFFLLIGALIYGQITTTVVKPKKIDDNYVWLSGVCREYLDLLPHWPYR